MTAPENQKFRALEGGFLPTLKSLYEDQEILNRMPVVRLGKEAIQNARPRPVTRFYSDMSLKMAEQFNASLDGEKPPRAGYRQAPEGARGYRRTNSRLRKRSG